MVANNIMSLPPMGMGQPGSPVQQGGGGRTDLVGYHSILDARRSMGEGARTPSADYPDGYLGTITSRREDRLLKTIKNRLTQRSYQRGVHKGSRIEPGDYTWSKDVNPQAGLEAEADGCERWAPKGTPVERLSHMGTNDVLSPQEMAKIAPQYGLAYKPDRDVVNPARSERMSHYLPSWH